MRDQDTTGPHPEQSRMPTRLTRRGFLRGLGLGAAALGAHEIGAGAGVAKGDPGLELGANAIAEENRRPALAQAAVTPPSSEPRGGSRLDKLIAGYGDAESVNRGESLALHISSKIGNFDLYVYRMGWYGGVGSRRMTQVFNLPGADRGVPTPQSGTGLVQCTWPVSYTVETGADWVSGAYLVALHPAGRDVPSGYIPFVVRDDASDAALVYQLPTNCWQAYNNWGGKSIYDSNSTSGVRAQKVTFDRPYAQESGAGQFFEGDFFTIRWLEREGIDVTYVTSVDTHRRDILRGNRRAFVTVFHDEYWSQQQRDRIANGLAGGKNMLFLGANNMYWRVRYEDAPDGRPARTWACSKDPSIDASVVRFRDSAINDPENGLLGGMYEYYNSASGGSPMVVKNTTHWLYDGTGLRDGDQIPNIVGYEWDRVFENGRTPAGLLRLSDSPVPGNTTWKQESTIYTHASGGVMFNAATCYWTYPLERDGWGTDERVRTMMRNLLRRLAPGTGATTATTTTANPPTTTVAPTARYQPITPVRLLDTRDGRPVGRGEKRTLRVTARAGIPASGVAALVANLTITDPSTSTYVVAYPAGATMPATSSVNAAARATVANLAILAANAAGDVELFNAFGDAHLLVDAVGWLPTGAYVPLNPARLFDSRTATPFGPGETRRVVVAGQAGVPSGAIAVAVNLTLTDTAANTYIVANPAAALRAATSSVNAAAGSTVANLALIALGSSGAIDLYNFAGTAHLIVDVLGWLPTGGYLPATPQRAYDTRATTALGEGETRRFAFGGVAGLPSSGIGAVAVNITVVGATRDTYLTAFAAGSARPSTSNVNAGMATTVANFAIVAASSTGAIDVYNSAGNAHVIIDVVGYFP